MTFGNASNLPDPETSRERLELETRVLAAALRQSLERGDTEGSSQAHHQIFILLKASQDMGWEEPISLPPDLVLEKKRSLPDIDWGAPEDDSLINASGGESESATIGQEDLDAAAEDEAEQSESQIVEPVESVASVESVESVASLESVEASEDSQQSEAAGPCETVEVAVSEKVVELADYYGQLNVDHMADFFTIHKSFLRQVRPLLLKQETEKPVGAPRKELLTKLQCMWVAHDILSDAVTRTDYDFRRMGLRSGKEAAANERSPKATPILRIGELLQCAGLLETTELEIAADMHKAMPELMFGAFLVKQGFIAEEDLNCVLLGQQLLKSAVVTVAQFQKAMEERATTSGDLGEILISNGFVTDAQLQEAYRNQSEETLPRVAAVTTVSIADSEAEVAQSLAEDSDDNENRESDDDSDEESRDGSLEFSRDRLHDPSHEASPAAAAFANANTADVVDAGQAKQSPSINSSLISGANAQVGAPVLSAGHAVPSWKDQLDWSSPDEDSTIAFTPEQNAEVQHEQTDFGHSGSVAPDAVPVSAGAEPENAEGARQPRKSLIDLMSGLEENPLVAVKDDEAESGRSDGSLSTILHKGAAVAAEDDFAPPGDDTQEFDGMAEEFAALDAAADEALLVDEDAIVPEVEHSEVVHAEVEQPEFTPQPQSQPAAQSLSVSQSQPQSQSVSQSQAQPEFRPHAAVNAAPSVSSSKDAVVPIEQQKESGSWSIVSVPASALASLLLDEDPEDAAATPLGQNASTTTIVGTADGAVQDEPVVNSNISVNANSNANTNAGANTNANASTNTSASPNAPTGKKNPPYSGPERRGKRRRTRS